MTPSVPTLTRRGLCAATLALALPAAMAWTDKPVKIDRKSVV